MAANGAVVTQVSDDTYATTADISVGFRWGYSPF